jgi:hypothetical protein
MIRRVFAAVSAWCLAVSSVLAAVAPDFLRDVRPILANHCFKCHGPDDAARQAELRLDSREAALTGGESGTPAFVVGKPDDSELIARIFSDDEDTQMPPPAIKHPLNDAQKDVLRRWIAAGAEYRPHWAFIAPKAVTPPKVKDEKWPRNNIDRFVLARLEAEGLAPSPEADRYALVRRVYLDLIGLPPTIEEADAFVNDKREDSYERLVDTLLQSEHYGERWARRWLDLARYADTNGYEKDRPRNIWPYRDWVIRALNADMPFDQFTIQQLAGDMLPNATSEQLIATGFHRNTMLNEEGGIDPLEFRFHAMTDRVATTGTTWLGLTIGCAQCHTHKFDPIKHTEYYGFMALLNNADEPEMQIVSPDEEAAYRARLAQAERLLADLPNKWPISEVRWEIAKPVSAVSESKQTPKMLDDGSVLFADATLDNDTYTIVLETPASRIEQLRLETLTDGALPAKGPGRTPHGNFVLGEIAISASPLKGSGDAKPVAVKIASAQADVEQPNFPVTAAFDGNAGTGWAVHAPGKNLNSPKTATFRFAEPVGFEGGTRLTITLAQAAVPKHTIGRPRLSLGAAMPQTGDVAARRREALEKSYFAWLAKQRAGRTAWLTPKPAEMASNSPLLALEEDGSIYASGDFTKDDRYEITFRDLPEGVTTMRVEALPDERLPAGGPGVAYYEGPKGDFFIGELQLYSPPGKERKADGMPIKIARASAFSSKPGESTAGAQRALDGNFQSGWGTDGLMGQPQHAVFVLEKPLAARELAVVMYSGRHYAASLGRFRISFTTHAGGAEAGPISPNVESLLDIPDEKLTDSQRATLRQEFLLTSVELAGEAGRIRELRKRPGGQTTLVMRERPSENPRQTFRHHRGEFLSPREEVKAGVPAFLPPLSSDASHDRLALARWIVSPENPLTARVAVNRQWAAIFGTGLVATQADFGFQGELPSHPELLDWLALEFVRQGWSLKKLHRLMVTSSTYRQSSVGRISDPSKDGEVGRNSNPSDKDGRSTTPSYVDDPHNRLLARGPRVRVEAEMVRDISLRASGLLSAKMFGPPVRPPQPAAVTETAYGGATWQASTGEDRYRRAIYTFTKRSTPFAALSVFDAPTGEACVARRDVSNTPLQALTLLNDETFVEAAKALGASTAAVEGDDAAKATFAFRRCLTRPPREAELKKLLAFVAGVRARIQAGDLKASEIAGTGEAATAVERAAWTTLARALLNLDETVTK